MSAALQLAMVLACHVSGDRDHMMRDVSLEQQNARSWVVLDVREGA